MPTPKETADSTRMREIREDLLQLASTTVKAWRRAGILAQSTRVEAMSATATSILIHFSDGQEGRGTYHQHTGTWLFSLHPAP